MPSAAEIAACQWLPDRELAVYAGEYQRNGFQGGLNWYRRARAPSSPSCSCSPAGRSTCRRSSSPARAIGASISAPAPSSGCRRPPAPAWSAVTCSTAPGIGCSRSRRAGSASCSWNSFERQPGGHSHYEGPTREVLRPGRCSSTGFTGAIDARVRFGARPPLPSSLAGLHLRRDPGAEAREGPPRGRGGTQLTVLFTNRSTEVRGDPAVLLKPRLVLRESLRPSDRRWSRRSGFPRRAWDPLSTFCPLYHSLTVPELWPGPEQVRRTDTLTSRAGPAGKFVYPLVRLRGIV